MCPMSVILLHCMYSDHGAAKENQLMPRDKGHCKWRLRLFKYVLCPFATIRVHIKQNAPVPFRPPKLNCGEIA